MDRKIVWIENRPTEGPTFIPGLRKKGYQVEIATNGAKALKLLKRDPFDLVVVNAPSLRTTGKGICRAIHKEWPVLPIIVLLNAGQSFDDASVNAVLTLPFTTRKLLNRIVLLLPVNPHSTIVVGPIRFDEQTRRLFCEKREARLTPRLLSLLKMLMEHPGEVIERGQLFREVWHTEYTGDTRTLDVHISWLRQALEANPRRPVYLKTVRGVGYRLDLGFSSV